MKRVLASRQHPQRLPFLHRAQAHGTVQRRPLALAVAVTVAIGEGRESGNGGGIEASLGSSVMGRACGRKLRQETVPDVDEDYKEDDEAAEGEADELEGGFQIAAGCLVCHKDHFALENSPCCLSASDGIRGGISIFPHRVDSTRYDKNGNPFFF